jgi:crossover junction endodeoxyribonuclease RuvC
VTSPPREEPPACRRVLGIDPGTRAVGWGVVERRGDRLACLGHGVLKADPKRPIDERLLRLAEALRAVIAEHEPDQAAIEEAFYGRDARAAQRIGEGRGALVLVAAEAGLPVAHYANNVVKKAVTGAGRASKQQVRTLIARLLELDAAPEGFDAADALALAVCHHHRRGLPGAAEGGLPPRVARAIERARARPRR